MIGPGPGSVLTTAFSLVARISAVVVAAAFMVSAVSVRVFNGVLVDLTVDALGVWLVGSTCVSSGGS